MSSIFKTSHFNKNGFLPAFSFELVGLDNREVLYRERHVLFSQLLRNLDGASKVSGNGSLAGGETVGRFTPATSLQVERLVIHQSPLVCLKKLFLYWCQTGSMDRTGQL